MWLDLSIPLGYDCYMRITITCLHEIKYSPMHNTVTYINYITNDKIFGYGPDKSGHCLNWPDVPSFIVIAEQFSVMVL